MKYIYLITIFFIFFGCKDAVKNNKGIDKEGSEEVSPIVKEHTKTEDLDIKSIDKSRTIELKQKQLIEKKDEREDLQTLIIDKKYLVDKKDYIINFKYPLLNESFKPTNSNFNGFINDYYVNITKTEEDILESKMLCDSIAAKNFREERFIDYKIYVVSDQLVSVLFYKENFYSGSMHPSYSFDCFNFDLNRGVFMAYEDFFIQGSEDELLTIINQKIDESINKGDLYYECWEISSDDFFNAKNNFVLNDDYVEFYFDDCIICPSYTGTYSIELPLTDVLSVLKKYELNPLVF
ncbi:hypothetical protein FBALC1_06763 [Flavobacteriales bacterium ALC-1]|nr:hypothetical protein FBALC1_06763 [Flavobacteriales bacterium ALC-1]